MWKIAITAKETGSRPSSLLCISDALAAYQLDCAVTTFRLLIENALMETIEVGVGSSKRSIPQYTLKEILGGRKLSRGEPGGNLGLLKGGEFYDEVG